jgi:hypothetical protein
LAAENARVDGAVRYFDVTQLEVEGRGWTDTPKPFDRLPRKAKQTVPSSVWNLSQHSAGVCVRFMTDAAELRVRWVLTSPKLALPHMPATGVSGLDLYVRQPSGAWRWLANGRPSAQTNVAKLFSDLPDSADPREFCLYLPLYNGVSEVEIGISAGDFLAKAPARPAERRRPLLFYGTSITHGCCASRPGMTHPAMVGRELDWPVINLGFSGSGKMEPAMAELIAELDPAVFILDCLPNMNGAMVTQRVEPFVKRLRRSHPDTPILLVEDRTYSSAFLNARLEKGNRENRLALRQAYGRLLVAGVKGLHYLPGEMLLGRDGEDTVDSSHPTDLGFARQAEAFLQVLTPIVRTLERE